MRLGCAHVVETATRCFRALGGPVASQVVLTHHQSLGTEVAIGVGLRARQTPECSICVTGPKKKKIGD